MIDNNREFKLAVLAGVTALGFQVAQWVRYDRINLGHWPVWPVSVAAHLVVLSTWTLAWLWCWHDHGVARLNKAMLWSVPIIAAIAAEAIQCKMKGHTPDVIGLVLNLVAAGGTMLVYKMRS